MDFDSFAIGFDHRDRVRLHALWESALDAEQWSEGPLDAAVRGVVERLERPARRRDRQLGRVGARSTRVPRRARPHRPLPVQHLHGHAARDPGRRRPGRVRRLQPRTTSACRSTTSSGRRTGTSPHAVFLVHIGGHIAFDVEQIAAYCRSEGIALIEDCAHAHGASWNGRRAGQLGRRRDLVVRSHQDDLDRRGRHARLGGRRADRVRPDVPQLRQARLRAARA